MIRMSLRLKINLSLLLVFALGLVAATALLYHSAREAAIERIEGEISVLRAQALAVRRYTSEEIRPLLADASDLQFLPQTVPSFAAQTAFRMFRDRHPEFYYKEAALNPTNPADLATDWEAEIIERLRADRNLTRVAELRETDAGPVYTVAYPLEIQSQECLACHSTPDVAPASMVALYGPEGGFGWSMNEIVGAQVFSAPLAQEDALRSIQLTALAMTGVFAATMLILNVLLSRMVIGPVTQMADIADRVSKGDMDQPEYRRDGRDEIASLAVSFNRMRRSLDNAMKMLDK